LRGGKSRSRQIDHCDIVIAPQYPAIGEPRGSPSNVDDARRHGRSDKVDQFKGGRRRFLIPADLIFAFYGKRRPNGFDGWIRSSLALR
jgi:hypothetical protein